MCLKIGVPYDGNLNDKPGYWGSLFSGRPIEDHRTLQILFQYFLGVYGRTNVLRTEDLQVLTLEELSNPAAGI